MLTWSTRGWRTLFTLSLTTYSVSLGIDFFFFKMVKYVIIIINKYFFNVMETLNFNILVGTATRALSYFPNTNCMSTTPYHILRKSSALYPSPLSPSLQPSQLLINYFVSHTLFLHHLHLRCVPRECLSGFLAREYLFLRPGTPFPCTFEGAASSPHSGLPGTQLLPARCPWD